MPTTTWNSYRSQLVSLGANGFTSIATCSSSPSNPVRDQMRYMAAVPIWCTSTYMFWSSVIHFMWLLKNYESPLIAQHRSNSNRRRIVATPNSCRYVTMSTKYYIVDSKDAAKNQDSLNCKTQTTGMRGSQWVMTIIINLIKSTSKKYEAPVRLIHKLVAADMR